MKKLVSAVTALCLMTCAVTPDIFTEKSKNDGERISLSAAAAESYDEIVSRLRQSFINRESQISFTVPSEVSSKWVTYDDAFDSIDNMVSDAMNETDDPRGGDYLRWHMHTHRVSLSGSTATLTVTYATTAEQEDELTSKVKSIINSLNFGSGSDYEKAKAIYEYVKKNVTYTKGNDIYYTAYGAGVKGTAVCEGYSLLLYRLLREVGIDCRILSGTAGGPHAWNMAEIDGIYYLLDVTFDSSIGRDFNYYFLKGTNDFDERETAKKHVFDVSDLEQVDSPYYFDYYKKGDFLSRYNISKVAYDPSNPVTETKTTSSTTTTTTTTSTTTAQGTTTESQNTSFYDYTPTVYLERVGSNKVKISWDNKKGVELWEYNVFYYDSDGMSSIIHGMTLDTSVTVSFSEDVDDYPVVGKVWAYNSDYETSKTGRTEIPPVQKVTTSSSTTTTTTTTTTKTTSTSTRTTTSSSTTTTTATTTAAPTGTLAPPDVKVEIANEKIYISWDEVPGAEKYQFVFMYTPTMESAGNWTISGTSRSFGYSGKTNYLKARSIGADGSYSDWVLIQFADGYLCGDANCDGSVNIADATAIVQHIANRDVYGLSEQGLINADCYNTGDGVTLLDALEIQKLEAGIIDSF